MSDEGPHAADIQNFDQLTDSATADIATADGVPADNVLEVGQSYDLHSDLDGYQAEIVSLDDPATARVRWRHASNAAIDGLEQALARSILTNPATATLAAVVDPTAIAQGQP